ncbi:MAG TPA: hypothetical protein VHZ76_00675 [Gammaproteobacteria bacterium]|jgi:hypothetical protein|nr:hypothetical protein [Gammaproteobacteria bacterium]
MSDQSYIGKFNIIVEQPYANKLYAENNSGGSPQPPPGDGFLIQDNGFDIIQDNGFSLLYIA